MKDEDRLKEILDDCPACHMSGIECECNVEKAKAISKEFVARTPPLMLKCPSCHTKMVDSKEYFAREDLKKKVRSTMFDFEGYKISGRRVWAILDTLLEKKGTNER